MALVTVDVCGGCGRFKGERHKATTKTPTLAKLERYSNDAVCPATDGCRVEPDGECEHGHVSWLRRLGWI